MQAQGQSSQDDRIHQNVAEYGGYNRPEAQRTYTSNYNRSFKGKKTGGFSKNQKDTRKPIDTADRSAKRDGPPMGQHLSTKSSELKNDPMYLDSFMPPHFGNMGVIAEEVNHFTGFSGLTPLINETFEYCAAKSKNFQDTVPLSVYAYYVGVMSWTRVLRLKQINQKRLTSNERDLIDVIYTQGNYILPKSVGLYLSGFGNFNIPSSAESRFSTLPYTYDNNGYFNDMADNFLTAHYPNISVYAQRIMEDLAITANPRANARWRVNGLNRPWNNRCLGYEDAQRLQSRHLTVFRSTKVTANEFPRDVNGFPINLPLLNNVQKYLNEVPSLETVPLPNDVIGSICQMITAVPEVVEHVHDLPDDIGSFAFRAQSAFTCPNSISYLGGSYLFRVTKSEVNHGFFFPYTIAEPTEEELVQLNLINTGWSPLLCEIYHFSTTPFKSYQRMKQVCSIDVRSS